jgi:DNA-directed RNA polymerase subunit K/omega
VVDENTTQVESTDIDQPAVPAVRVPPIESRFLFVDVAALRAKQLRRGARPRLPGLTEAEGATTEAPRKAERIAMEEVRQGLVHYDVPGPDAAEGPR